MQHVLDLLGDPSERLQMILSNTQAQLFNVPSSASHEGVLE